MPYEIRETQLFEPYDKASKKEDSDELIKECQVLIDLINNRPSCTFKITRIEYFLYDECFYVTMDNGFLEYVSRDKTLEKTLQDCINYLSE